MMVSISRVPDGKFTWMIRWLVGLMLVIPAVCPVSAENAPTRILVRNVSLIDPSDPTRDVTLNLLVVDGKLDLVTEDEIPVEDINFLVEGENRVLMGILDAGSPANFMILDEDPRGCFDCILDTKAHIVFAMRQGIVVADALKAEVELNPKEPAETPTETKKERPFRVAYAPPPVALPVGYLDSTAWNRWQGKAVSGGFLAALALDRQVWVSQDHSSEDQVGDLDSYDGGEIRLLRFGTVGTFNFERPWYYTLFVATNVFDKGFDVETTDELVLYDARVDIPLSDTLTLGLGRQKEPISMSRLMTGIYLPMQERAGAVDAMLRSRNDGVTISGIGLDRRLTWSAGVFGDSVDTPEGRSEWSTQYAGRVTWLPFVDDNGSEVVHLGLGLRHTDAAAGIRYRTEPEFNRSPNFVDTGLIEADGAWTLDLEASWRMGPFWVGAEFLRSFLDTPQAGDPTFGGFTLTGSWILSGEMRKYDRRSGTFGPVPVAKSVYQGGDGAIEAAIRFSTVDLDDGPIEGGRMDAYSLGLNWWLTPVFAGSVDYRHIVLDRFGLSGSSDGFTLRVLLMLN